MKFKAGDYIQLKHNRIPKIVYKIAAVDKYEYVVKIVMYKEKFWPAPCGFEHERLGHNEVHCYYELANINTLRILYGH